MKKLSLLIVLSFASILAFAQTSVKGQVTDGETNEPLIGVNVMVGTTGTNTDIDGFYELKLNAGTYEVRFSYIGYEDVLKTVVVGNDAVKLDVSMGGSAIEIQMVEVVSDQAISRKTPVAFSSIPTAKLNEELASQDLPMVLNSTPGAYATNQGGGDGDARVSIRGFDQRNIAVMLDGIPVNDMENGWVYWSNWFGLDLVTKTMQVQRGLGASKLAIPSVGGTINILTRGIDSRRQTRFRQEVGNDGFLRSTVGFTSGRLENGWGFSAAGSYKQGNGWVDANFTQGYFYYLRVDKEIGNHLITLSGFGAPQSHGQRPFSTTVAAFDTTYAKTVGIEQAHIDDLVNNDVILDQGLRYNANAGYLNGEIVNTRINYYHKPQISLRHSWKGGKRFFLSNVAYVSIGNGGGTAPIGSATRSRRPEDNLIDLDAAYEINTTSSIFKEDGLSENYLRASVNNHFWYGLLSTAEFTMDDNWTFSGGIDLRDYVGEHLRTPYDLYGGSFLNNSSSSANATLPLLRDYRRNAEDKILPGDAMEYNYRGYVRWGGIFGMAEYDKDKVSAFVNVSTAVTGYAYEDFMKHKLIKLSDTTLRVSAIDTINYGDQTYTLSSPEAENFRIDWLIRPSFTIKTGAVYRFNRSSSLFVNVGYLSRPTRYRNVIQRNINAPELNQDGTINYQDAIVISDAKNEIVTSFEMGYTFKSPVFTTNLNAYFTNWENRPLDRLPTEPEDPSDPESDRIPVNIQGLAARHAGFEAEFVYKITDELRFEGIASIGDWIWNSSDSVLLNDGSVYAFDPTGVHVGDAAQIQLGAMMRYEPIKGLYFKVRSTYFAKNYASFTPESLNGDNARRDSWRMPNYTLVDFHTGYNFKIKGVRTGVRFNILNLLNTTYIADARNNDTYNPIPSEDFDAKSASVFLGQGIRWNTSIQFTF